MTFDCELVIARHNEALRWVLDVPAHIRVVVYSKSRKALAPDVMQRIDKLERAPNVGREAHTYLTHIVNNYSSLAKITAFVQGNPRDHGFGTNWDTYFGIPKDTHSRSMKLATAASSRAHTNYTNWGHLSRLRKGSRWSDVKFSKLTLSEWWMRYISKDLPDRKAFRCSWGACFSVTDVCILKHTRKYYRKLLATVSSSDHPEEAHYLERAWAYIFPPTDRAP